MGINFFGKDKHFYHASIRRYTLLFGTIFSDMYIKRDNGDTGVLIKVPLRYGPGHAYEKIAQDKESREQNKVRLVVPSMSFEMQTLQSDDTRKENTHVKITRTTQNSDGSVNAQFNRVPYNINFVLTAITKNVDDMLQITEQILPIFAPNITIKMKDIDNTVVDVEQDIKIFLVGVEMNDNWEQPEESRYVEYTFNFELRGYLYGRTVEVATINEIELRTIMEVEGGSSQTIMSIFDKGFSETLKLNGKHYEAVNGLTVDMTDIDEETGATKQTKRTRKKNK